MLKVCSVNDYQFPMIILLVGFLSLGCRKIAINIYKIYFGAIVFPLKLSKFLGHKMC